jgi:hypothetical protein
MLEQIISRVKVCFFLALFLSPVMVSAWSRSLDRWLESNHRFEPLPSTAFVAEVPVELAAMDH